MPVSDLTLTVLADNSTLTDVELRGEPGLSFLLETGTRKILFDTGLSGLFLDNAERLGIDLRDTDLLVFSHGHRDHTGGLSAFIRYLAGSQPAGAPVRVPELVAHPRCFWPRERDGTMNGSPVSEAEAARHFRLRLSALPVWLTRDLIFLGEVPHRFAFEQGEPGSRKLYYPDGSTGPDPLADDSALVFRSDTGLVIITGCSHAGICTITEYAKEVCGEPRVRDIIGGFHLTAPAPVRWEGTGGYLAGLSLEALHACHCTSLAARIALAAHCPVQETGVGMTLRW